MSTPLALALGGVAVVAIVAIVVVVHGRLRQLLAKAEAAYPGPLEP